MSCAAAIADNPFAADGRGQVRAHALPRRSRSTATRSTAGRRPRHAGASGWRRATRALYLDFVDGVGALEARPGDASRPSARLPRHRAQHALAAAHPRQDGRLTWPASPHHPKTLGPPAQGRRAGAARAVRAADAPGSARRHAHRAFGLGHRSAHVARPAPREGLREAAARRGRGGGAQGAAHATPPSSSARSPSASASSSRPSSSSSPTKASTRPSGSSGC